MILETEEYGRITIRKVHLPRTAKPVDDVADGIGGVQRVFVATDAGVTVILDSEVFDRFISIQGEVLADFTGDLGTEQPRFPISIQGGATLVTDTQFSDGAAGAVSATRICRLPAGQRLICTAQAAVGAGAGSAAFTVLVLRALLG